MTHIGTFIRRLLWPAMIGVVALFAVAAPASAAHTVRVDHQGTPQTTVRDFLSAALVEQNPNTASAFLDPRARLSYERGLPTHPDDAQFFADSHLTLGGLTIQSNRQLGELAYRVLPGPGADVTVQVSHHGQALRFVLAPATSAELGEFHAPPTSWRVDSSVAALNPS